ncbi:MAG: class I mannose-6-phosphate isomerase [Bryobacteraceae bacterium]
MPFEKQPYVAVDARAADCEQGWLAIFNRLRGVRSVAIECYPGVDEDAIASEASAALPDAFLFLTSGARRPACEVDRLIAPYLTEDPVFGRICDLTLDQFFDNGAGPEFLADRPLVVIGQGATMFLPNPTILIYADMPRWEIQQRQRRGDSAAKDYKRGYFVDWRVADRWKRPLLDRADFLLDTTDRAAPKMITGESFRAALAATAHRPFRVVPFFDPGPWGGQWMRRVCGLPDGPPNYAWCFNCVPEENSLLLGYGDVRVEIPAMDLVLRHPRELLGERVYERFGAEFPIRFDFLDTMDGGNLSVQVHPLAPYAREHFGVAYTQDESYYILDAGPDASVYLGLKTGVDRDRMVADLRSDFDADCYLTRWPARRHDHFSIPAGTIHCAGRNCLVLEISATPYIFTFKLWDWNRFGLDGKPRPIHLDHGLANLQWERDTEWVRGNLLTPCEPVASGESFREERTGLDRSQFIETRRHWFRGPVRHSNGATVNVLNLVQGDEITVESPSGSFEPMVIHYPETFIVPAAAGDYIIRPSGPSLGTECATVKAYVRDCG